MSNSRATFRSLAAIELRLAAGLRRDLRLGIVQRGPALSAIRDHIRHARALIVATRVVAGLS